MGAPFDKLRRPLDRVLYSPLREQHQANQKQRTMEIERRKAKEKARGLSKS